MKKVVLLALTAVMMAGCKETKRAYPETYSTNEMSDASITYTAGGCEYWIYQNKHGGIPIHKGNCRFCKERRQKELEELVIKLKEK